MTIDRLWQDYKDAKWATLVKVTYTDPEGAERTWESAERLTRPKGSDIDGVGVAAILQDPAKPDDEPHIVLQKQWRPPVNQTVIEVPAGLMDPNESPETCALRELKEETGYIGEVVKDKSFVVSPIMFNGGCLVHEHLIDCCSLVFDTVSTLPFLSSFVLAS